MAEEPFCDVRTSAGALIGFTHGHLMKIKWLVANVTAARAPDRAERAILGVILAEQLFDQFRS